MANPFTMKSWSPFTVGIAIGVLSWLAFATANKHLAITLQYEHIAAMAQTAVTPEAALSNRYYAVRTSQGLEPKVGWYLMLLVAVCLGAFLSSWLSGDRSRTLVPALWHWRFGDRPIKRFAAAFAGGAIMVFGARIAGGCTSGHGISGTLQLAVQSWTFIGLAFGAAVATAFLMFGWEGRTMLEIEPLGQLLLGLVTGVAFGFLLQKEAGRKIPDYSGSATAQGLDHF